MLRFPETVRQSMADTALKSVGAFVNLYSQLSFHGAGQLAFRLFSYPRSSLSRRHHPELLRTAQSEKLTVEGRDIQLFHWPGDGPHIFLAHGWESNASRWLPLIRRLRQQNYHITAIDAPAHGLSGGRRFNVLLYTQTLEAIFAAYPPEIFIGHSAGGMAGVFSQHRNKLPSLQRLILLAVPCELDQLMDTFRQIVGMNDRVFDGLRYSFEHHFGFPMTAFSMCNFIAELGIPGLLIHDRADTIAPFAGAESIYRNWPNAQFVTTEGLGHSLPGEEVVDAIMTYLTRRWSDEETES